MKAEIKILSNSFLNLISKVNPFLVSFFTISIVTLICIPISSYQGYHVISLILLFTVSVLATFLSIGPVLLASALSALVWNFFFIPPNFTFHIEKTEDILMFFMFFIIAFINGIMTTRIRRQEQIALERELKTNALFQLTKDLSKTSGVEELIKVSGDKIKQYFNFRPNFILQDGNNVLSNSYKINSIRKYDKEILNVADWVFKAQKKAGRNSDNFPGITYSFLPLKGVKINPGVMFFEINQNIQSNQQDFFETMFILISNALEREILADMAQKAKLLDESDKLYKTLFNSISHELRIPVATILGSADTLLSESLPENIQLALISEISAASIRLNRIIENLLNISRIESERILPRFNWCDVNDLVNKVTQDLNEELKPFSFKTSIPDDIPLIKIDFGLMEQVLYNLLINSCEHSPVASTINLEVFTSENAMVFEILDRGPGFQEDSIKYLFNKFYKTEGSNSSGLGLGLSIVKGFVEAHKGNIIVENRKNGGAKFTIKIPLQKYNIDDILMNNV